METYGDEKIPFMVHKRSTNSNPFLYVRKQLEGDSPYSHLINLYKSIEAEIANGNDPVGWRLIRSELDGVLDIMGEMNLLRGKR